MRRMRRSHSVCIVSWLLLILLLNALGLTDGTTSSAEEKIGEFVKYPNGTAFDTRTNLLWMTKDFRNLEGRAPKNWDEAMAWVEKMNQQRYGGYNDWRVPTDAEYKTLYDPRRSKVSYAKQPVGYPEAFEDGGGEWYWTGERRGMAANAFAQERGGERYSVDFIRGNVVPRNPRDAQNYLSIRLVRTGTPRAPGIAVLKSHDIAPINQALAGFLATCPEQVTTYDLGGNASDTQGMMTRLMASPPRLIVAIGPLAAQVARTEARGIPLLFLLVRNPRQQGLEGDQAMRVNWD